LLEKRSAMPAHGQALIAIRLPPLVVQTINTYKLRTVLNGLEQCRVVVQSQILGYPVKCKAHCMFSIQSLVLYEMAPKSDPIQ
jgi:hypothetical protein